MKDDDGSRRTSFRGQSSGKIVAAGERRGRGGCARGRQWSETAGVRFEAVVTTAPMNGVDKSAWCRERGVYPPELQKWRASCTAAGRARGDEGQPAGGGAAGEGLIADDGRPQAVRPVPSRALSEAERAELRRVANEPRFAAVRPARIVPMLVDEGPYLAREFTFSRVLRAHGQTVRRGRAKASRAVRRPTAHIATAPRAAWCSDMTYLPATVIDSWFHLDLILDLYGRKIVGWEVHDTDDSVHAVHLVRRKALAEDIATMLTKPVRHGDNGSTLKATTVLAMLHWLGVKPSYSRPRVSDDNSYAESLFRAAKYRPEFPTKGFADLDAARAWAASFFVGTTATIATAASATSARLSVTPVKATRSWPRVRRSPPRPESKTRRAGHAPRATGRPLAP